jgi:uncharacterized membrane protein YozB (DUF420 family)
MSEIFPFFPIPAGFEEGIWEVMKLVVLTALIFYLVFTIVVIRQVQLMTRTVTGEIDQVIQVIAWLHFGLTAAIFVLALLFL